MMTLGQRPCFFRFNSAVILFMMIAVSDGSIANIQKQEQERGQEKQEERQTPATNEERAQELIKDKKYSFEDIRKRDPGAIANVEQIFILTNDARTKGRSASILLIIGVRDQIYFDYLAAEAKAALNSDMPWPTLYDEHGNKITKTIETLNPAFLKWCKKHHRDPGDAFEEAYYGISQPWYDLGAAGDPRFYSLLVRGIHSQNLMIQAFSALGLAKLQDPRAIDEIIGAVRRAPMETHDGMAKALLYFSDPKAQKAADELFLDKRYIGALRDQIKEKG